MQLQKVKDAHAYSDSKYIPIQGMDVHYRDVGEGKTLILLHGMFASLHTWDHWVNVLSQDFRVIAIDLPNYGFTGPHPKGVYDHMYSDFMNDFTNALGIESCMIAGNSLGGFVSWEFAYRFPEKVSKIILLDAAGFFLIPPPLMLVMSLPFAVSISSMIRLPRPVIQYVLNAVYGDKNRIQPGKLELYHALNLRHGNTAASTRVVQHIRNKLIQFGHERLQEVKQPTLVMWGDKDRWIPVSHAQKFCDALPNAEKIIYPGVGHIPMEEIPEESVADARKFLLSQA